MKKIILLAALFIGISLGAQEPKSIGVRGGAVTFDFVYQNYTKGADFLDLSVGLNYFGQFGLSAGAAYNFVIAQPNWTSQGQWSVYAGPGVTTGFYAGKEHGGFLLGFSGQLGLEYAFDFPMEISIETKPQIGFGIGSGSTWFNKHNLLYGLVPSLSLRYSF